MNTMLRIKKDLTGMRFHKLEVVKLIGIFPNGANSSKTVWECRCDCGTYCTATTNQLNSGKKKSCGCAHKIDNQIYTVGDIGICLMRNGYFWFDIADIDFVERYHWQENAEGYATAYVSGRNIRFARELLDVKDSNTVVDHINGDRHDNRRCNLRVCSIQNNTRHRFGTKGYSKTPAGRYAARIYKDNKRIYLGTFDTEAEAKAAYAAAAEALFGEFQTYEDDTPFYPVGFTHGRS